ncbi:MAG: hypothetical protein ABH840_02600 [Nanoarchaeota archaeon]
MDEADLAERASSIPEQEKNEFKDNLSKTYSKMFDTLVSGSSIGEETGRYRIELQRKVWDTKTTKGKHRYEMRVYDRNNQKVIFYRDKAFEKLFAYYLFTKNRLKLNSVAV